MSGIEVYISYNREDTDLLQRLVKALYRPLKDSESVVWHKGMIGAGQNVKAEIKLHRENAKVFVLLWSANYINDDECYDEMDLIRSIPSIPPDHVIPILLRHAALSRKLSDISRLPIDGDPLVTRTNTLDRRIADVAEYIVNIVEEAVQAANVTSSAVTESSNRSTSLDNWVPKIVTVSPKQLQMARQELQAKRDSGIFDVFLCHNHEDKPMVITFAERLMEQGILPWLDLWESRPGSNWVDTLETQITTVKSAAVFVGKKGTGPWQKNELSAFLREFVQRQCPVIPVLLPDTPTTPMLPVFLSTMTWVDFRSSRNKNIDDYELERLIWGITGKKTPLKK